MESEPATPAVTGLVLIRFGAGYFAGFGCPPSFVADPAEAITMEPREAAKIIRALSADGIEAHTEEAAACTSQS